MIRLILFLSLLWLSSLQAGVSLTTTKTSNEQYDIRAEIAGFYLMLIANHNAVSKTHERLLRAAKGDYESPFGVVTQPQVVVWSKEESVQRATEEKPQFIADEHSSYLVVEVVGKTFGHGLEGDQHIAALIKVEYRSTSKVDFQTGKFTFSDNSITMTFDRFVNFDLKPLEK